MLFRRLIQWCKCGALYKKKIRKILNASFLWILRSDSVGIRTRGLLLRRQLLYPAELRNRPYDVISVEIGCKGRHFLGNFQISDNKSYVRAVVEGVIALNEGFCGLKFANIQWVVATLLIEPGLSLCKGRGQMRITIAGKDNLPGTEIEGDDGHFILGDGKTVNHGIGDVLVVHHFEHRGNHHFTGWVVGL